MGNMVKLHEEEVTKEKAGDKIINANKAARNKPLKAYKSAMKAAKRARGLEECPGLEEAYQAWYAQAKGANDSELAFHHVEFSEFDEDDKCTNAAKEQMQGECVNPKEFALATFGCYRKVKADIKKAIVNKADDKRKVDRKGLGGKWRAMHKIGRKCFKKRNLALANYRRSLEN